MEFAIGLLLLYWAWSGGFGKGITYTLRMVAICAITFILFTFFPNVTILLATIFLLFFLYGLAESYYHEKQKKH